MLHTKSGYNFAQLAHNGINVECRIGVLGGDSGWVGGGWGMGVVEEVLDELQMHHAKIGQLWNGRHELQQS